MDEKKIEERVEQIVKDAEQRINELGDKFDEKIVEEKLKHAADRIHRRVEERLDEAKKSRCSHRNSEFWGIVLIVIGFIFLADNLHWIRWSLPWIPTILIIFGGFLVFQSMQRD